MIVDLTKWFVALVRCHQIRIINIITGQKSIWKNAFFSYRAVVSVIDEALKKDE